MFFGTPSLTERSSSSRKRFYESPFWLFITLRILKLCHVFRTLKNTVFFITPTFIRVSLTYRRPFWLTDSDCVALMVCFLLIGLCTWIDWRRQSRLSLQPEAAGRQPASCASTFLVDQHWFIYSHLKDTQERQNAVHLQSSPPGKPWKRMGFKRKSPQHPSLLYPLIHSGYRLQTPEMFWKYLRSAF